MTYLSSNQSRELRYEFSLMPLTGRAVDELASGVHIFSLRSAEQEVEAQAEAPGGSHSVVSATLWPVDCRSDGAPSGCGFLQVNTGLLAISFSKGSSQTKDYSTSPALKQIPYSCATWQALSTREEPSRWGRGHWDHLEAPPGGFLGRQDAWGLQGRSLKL